MTKQKKSPTSKKIATRKQLIKSAKTQHTTKKSTAKKTVATRHIKERQPGIVRQLCFLVLAVLIIVGVLAWNQYKHVEAIHLAEMATENVRKPVVKLKPPTEVKTSAVGDTSLTVPPGGCERSLLNVVAHEDDDLLFMNPDLVNEIHSGMCVTTVYLTAGDAGSGSQRWQSRELGAEAAYSHMYDRPLDWQIGTAMVNDHPVVVAHMPDVPQMTMVFFRLPDGNLDGSGFADDKYESMGKLRSGKIDKIHSVDNQTPFTAQQLTDSILGIMNAYAPNVVSTQNFNDDEADGDHSDHHAAGYFTEQAYKDYKVASVLKVYAGYTIRSEPSNVDGSNYDEKVASFLAYAAQDPWSCSSREICMEDAGYGAYLSRQYTVQKDQHEF